MKLPLLRALAWKERKESWNWRGLNPGLLLLLSQEGARIAHNLPAEPFTQDLIICRDSNI